MAKVVYNAVMLRPPYSGVEKSVLELGRGLNAQPDLALSVLAPPDAAAVLGGEAVRIPFRSRALRIAWEQIVLPARLRRMGAALLHAPAYVAPLACPCRFVLSVYDLHVFTHASLCTASNRLHYRALMPSAIRRAAALLVPSAHTGASLAARFPSAAVKTHVVPLGVSAPYLRPVMDAEMERVRRRYGLPPAFVLFVGDSSPRKNLAVLQAAAAQIRQAQPDTQLVMAGQPPRAERAPEQGVLRIGYVPESDLPALYGASRCLLFPSLDEGFGLPVLEAMACGCPVVCSGGAPSEFGAGVAVFCASDDPHAFAAAALRLMTDGPARVEVLAAGRERAARYTWEAAAAATTVIYRGLTAQNR